MIRTITIIFLIGVLLSCEVKKREENKNISSDLKTTIVEKYQFRGKPLLEYEKFIEHLDSYYLDNMNLAMDKFCLLFKNSDRQTCDSAYYIFDNYYSRVHKTANDLINNEPNRYDSLVTIFPDKQKNVLSKALIEYKNKITRNGFRISTIESFIYIEKDRDYVKENIYNFLTPTMVTYLEQLNKENKEGFGDDGGLTIKPETLIDRVIWWDNFCNENKDFIFKEFPYDLRKSYKYALIIGADNTPVLYNYDKILLFNDYFKTAYEYLLSKYPESETAKLIRPYYSALTTKDTLEISKFRKRNLTND